MKIGVDIGGTKIEIVALNERGEAQYRTRVSTPKNDYPGTLKVLRELVAQAEQHVGKECTVGIGLPGVVSKSRGVMKNANSTWLNGRDFYSDVSRVLNREIRIENDANCFALHEAVFGAGRNYDVVFGVIMGTGVGGGIVVYNQLISGPNALSGEWGHNPQPWTGVSEADVQCYCGKYNCIETFLSGPGFMQRFDNQILEHSSVTEVANSALQGNEAAREVMDNWYRLVSAAFATIVNVVDPDVIVLGGGLSKIPSLAEHIHMNLKHYVFGSECVTEIVVAEHGDASGVFGAALLW